MNSEINLDLFENKLNELVFEKEVIEIIQIIQKIYDLGCIKVSDEPFKLSSGGTSNIYIDLRKTFSNTTLLNKISEQIYEKYKDLFEIKDLSIIGVPYGGIPLAFNLTQIINKHKPENKVTFVLKRKEPKTGHGINNKLGLEGIVKNNVILVEDTITTGNSIEKVKSELIQNGYNVISTICILNRSEKDYKCLMTLKHLLNILNTKNIRRSKHNPILIIDDTLWNWDKSKEEQLNKIFPKKTKLTKLEEINSIKINDKIDNSNKVEETGIESINIKKDGIIKTYNKNTNSQGLKEWLNQVDILNQSNRKIKDSKNKVIISIDETKHLHLLNHFVLKDLLGVKLHFDCYEGITNKYISSYIDNIKRNNAFVIEDRKFADIGATVFKQMKKNKDYYERMDYVTVHAIGGESTILGIREFNRVYSSNVKALLVYEMSTMKTHSLEDYKNLVKELTKLPEVVGCIGQVRPKEIPEPLLWFTPGVSLKSNTDTLGQNYRTPKECFASGSDALIIGRALTASKNPEEVLKNINKEQ